MGPYPGFEGATPAIAGTVTIAQKGDSLVLSYDLAGALPNFSGQPRRFCPPAPFLLPSTVILCACRGATHPQRDIVPHSQEP